MVTINDTSVVTYQLQAMWHTSNWRESSLLCQQLQHKLRGIMYIHRWQLLAKSFKKHIFLKQMR